VYFALLTLFFNFFTEISVCPVLMQVAGISGNEMPTIMKVMWNTCSSKGARIFSRTEIGRTSRDVSKIIRNACKMLYTRKETTVSENIGKAKVF
jgi:hypothetical protein